MDVDKVSKFIADADFAYEEDILRNPQSVKGWLRYAEHKKDCSAEIINLLYERALKQLPGSYKLWYTYLKLRRRQVRGRCITDPIYEDVNNAFERSLVFMHKMPRIWLDYCQFLMNQYKVTRTRWTFDRALRSLPISQHHRVWPLYLKFLEIHGVKATCLRVWRRYLKLKPENAEDFIDYLMDVDEIDEAAVRLAGIVNDESFISKRGCSKFKLWMNLCDIISKNPDKIKSLNVRPIIRQGIDRFTDQRGQLWNSLADYYIRSGLFGAARDVYEEALATVITVRDFTQIFDAYAQFEEGLINAKMKSCEEQGITSAEDDLELEISLSRFENLMERRPLLLNSVLLRQNPHNVSEWLKRVKLMEDKPLKIINTFQEAVSTVDPFKAVGKPQILWIEFAKFYETNNQLEDARPIFEKATEVKFKNVEDLAQVWCEYAEMELRHNECDLALRLMQRATTPPPRKAAYYDQSEPVQGRVYRSLKIWSLYADLEESFGSFKTAKAVYDAILDLRIATPQIIINYAAFLEEHHYFEEAFKIYERGVALFKWPNVFDIWQTYLSKFINRYGGNKLERIRDLFEQCLDGIPAEFAKKMHLLYGKVEEDYGMARHAMAIYDRAVDAVTDEEKVEVFNVYLSRATEIYGVTYTRQIYEKAIEILPDNGSREMSLRYAELETKMGEIDRARGIYAHCSQICNPEKTSSFWENWKQFEVKYGNEDTLREMLRIRRSVQATFNTTVNVSLL